MVSCEHVWREISNYLEGEVDASLRAVMDEHFRTCQRCKAVLEGTRNVIALYGDERMIEVPAGFGRRLERRLSQSVRPRESRWSTWSAWMVPVAALVLIAGGLRLASSLTVTPPVKSEHAQPARQIPPEMQVVVSVDSKVFHRAGCPFIHNKQTERVITAKQAMEQGYVPCSRCMRKYVETAQGRPGGFQLHVDASFDDDDDTPRRGQ